MDAQAVLESYKGALTYRLQHPERFADTRPVDFNEGLFIFQDLHPTKRRESMELTERLIEYLVQAEVATMEDIQRDLSVSHPAVLKRMNVLRRSGMVRRESKKFYIATPRLAEFKTKFLKRLLKGVV